MDKSPECTSTPSLPLDGLPSPSSALKESELLSLPDVPLQALICRIPLQSLITTIPLLHPRLASFRATALKGTTRLELALGYEDEIAKMKCESKLRLPFVGHLIDPTTGALLYPQTDLSDFYRLNLGNLDYRAVYQLATLMPAIAHLEVAIFQMDILLFSGIIQLLTAWSATLETLKITGKAFQCYSDTPETVASYMLSRLLFAISELSSLENLTLELDEQLFFRQNSTGRATRLNYPLIKQLKEFNYFSTDAHVGPEFLLTSLEEFASERLTSIRLATGDIPFLSRDPVNPYAICKVSSLFSIVPTTEEDFFSGTRLRPFDEPLLRACTNLQFYRISWEANEAEKWSHQTAVLSSLAQLLCLQINLRIWVDSDDNEEGILAPDNFNLSTLTPLPAVKVLLLRLSNHASHTALSAPFWATLFPSVQIIKLVHKDYFCKTCFPGEAMNAREELEEYNDEILPCIEQFIAPLAVLPALRKIFYQRNTGNDFIAEFTPGGEFVDAHQYIY